MMRDLIMLFVGGFIAYIFGMTQALRLDRIKMQENEKAAALIIGSELSRIIAWHGQLLAYQDEDRPFEIWGLFLPVSSLGQCRAMMKKMLGDDGFVDLEKAYTRFSTYDRQMQSVVQAWSSSGHETPTGPAVRWQKVFWDSIRDEATKELVERLRLLLEKLDDIAAGRRHIQPKRP
jgi:hypothetical protein